MQLNETLEEAYEAFEGDMRKLEELISQLELWSDECTANHKKEEVRLPQYIELHMNLEALKKALQEEVSSLSEEEALKEKMDEASVCIEKQLARYALTEQVIHAWVREIKNIYVLINQSRVLEQNKDYLLAILEADQ